MLSFIQHKHDDLLSFSQTENKLVGCKRELWEKLNKSSCLYSKKDHMRDETFGLKYN